MRRTHIWKTTKCLLRVTSSWIPSRRNYSRRVKALPGEVSQVDGLPTRLMDLLDLLDLELAGLVVVLVGRPWLSSKPWPWLAVVEEGVAAPCRDLRVTE